MPLRPLARIPRHRLLLVLLLITVTWGSWVAWARFQRSGASFNANGVERFLDDRLAALSDSVYRVRVGTLHLDPPRQAARIDTLLIFTDTARNARLARPYPILRLIFHEAEVRGLVLPSDSQSLHIGEIRFGNLDAEVTFVPRDTVAGAASSPGPASPPIFTWDGALPADVPQVEIDRIVLHGITATIRTLRGQQQRVDQLGLVFDSVRLDPRAEGAKTPILVADIRLLLSRFSGGWDSISTLAVGELQGSFRDSTLSIRHAALLPTRTIAETFRRGRYRRDRIAVVVDSLSAAGVDWRGALRDGAIPMRSLTLTGPDLVIYSDKRLPRRPGEGARRPILQEVLARFGRPLTLDTIRIRNGRVRYQERLAGGRGTGEVDFQDLDARLTGLRWGPEERRDQMAQLDLSAKLWGEGEMALTIRAPVAVERAMASVDLFVGPMPLALFNRIATAVAPMDIREGMLDSARVRGTIVGDRAVGEVRPYYRGLSIRPQGGSGGPLGWLKRGATSVVANSFVVRDENPDDEGILMVGPFDRTRLPGQTFWPFAWTFTRDGLLLVAMGKGTELRH
jgi:hypothetical protein